MLKLAAFPLNLFPELMINVFTALLWKKNTHSHCLRQIIAPPKEHPKPGLVHGQRDFAPSVLIERVQDEIRHQMGSFNLSLKISLFLFPSLVLSFEHNMQKCLLL